jgi:hypothetical protein
LDTFGLCWSDCSLVSTAFARFCMCSLHSKSMLPQYVTTLYVTIPQNFQKLQFNSNRHLNCTLKPPRRLNS